MDLPFIAYIAIGFLFLLMAWGLYSMISTAIWLKWFATEEQFSEFWRTFDVL